MYIYDGMHFYISIYEMYMPISSEDMDYMKIWKYMEHVYHYWNSKCYPTIPGRAGHLPSVPVAFDYYRVHLLLKCWYIDCYTLLYFEDVYIDCDVLPLPKTWKSAATMVVR